MQNDSAADKVKYVLKLERRKFRWSLLHLYLTRRFNQVWNRKFH